MVDVVTEVIIHKPIEQVADYASDPKTKSLMHTGMLKLVKKPAMLL